MDDNITAARQRLHQALISGEQTDGHREALARLEADLEASGAKVEVQAEKAEARQTKALEKRSQALVAEVQAAIDLTLSRFPCPEV